MSESLRDRVAREAMLVHYKPEAVDKEQAEDGPSWRDYGRIADALIADGLVYGVGLDRDRAEFFKRQRDQAWRRIKIMGWVLAGTTALSIIGLVELVAS